MSPLNLTPRQSQVLNFVQDFSNRYGFAPSIREIGDAVGLSSSATVHSHLKRLEVLGVLRRQKGRTRSVVSNQLKITTPRTPYVLALEALAKEASSHAVLRDACDRIERARAEEGG